MEKRETGRARIWELDFLRGIALILMIYFHVIFDLYEFYNVPVSYYSGINYYIGKTSAILFMLLSGISSSLSRSNIKRGLKILGIALVITLVSHLYNPDFGIKFGILHFLGICMLLYPLFSKLNKYLLILIGTGIIVLGRFISNISVANDYLFPFGIYSPTFVSSDYYPLIPWLGVFLYGIALGKFLYSKKQSIIPFEIDDNPVSIIGRHTLTVYLLHQPVILAILWLIFYLKG